MTNTGGSLQVQKLWERNKKCGKSRFLNKFRSVLINVTLHANAIDAIGYNIM